MNDLILKSLTINHFKNIAEASLDFSPNVNAFLGNNGMGKSNLLDAIYYLSFCKSFAGLPDAKLITRGETFTMVRALYDRRGQNEEILFGMTQGRRKSFKRQGKEYQRLSQHIGSFPLVIVSPRDMNLITGASEERRRFVDMIISQTDPVYLDRLIRYNAALQQRNRLLRDHVVNPDVYAAIEAGMAMAAEYITDRRQRLISDFAEIFTADYRDIARTDETPALIYRSDLNETRRSLDELLDENRRRDEIMGHTTVGPHRDDLTLLLDEMPVRTTASQGQSKTFTIAMRLAQYEFLHRAVGMKPLLLLDDIFDKLDSARVANIIEIVSRDTIGQIFITDTNRDHLDSIMARSGADYRLWDVTDGRFTPQTSHAE